MALILKGRTKLKGSTVIGKRPYAIDGVFNPELVADFPKEYYRKSSAATTFGGLITHSRASTATMVDSDGVLKWAPHNLVARSEEFDNAVWFKFRATIGANATTAPDGSLTADKIQEEAAASSWPVVQQGSPTAGLSYTFSVFAKADDVNFVVLDTSGGTKSTWFNLATGAVGTTHASHTASIKGFGSGWYLCTVSFVAASGDNTNIRVASADASTAALGTTGHGIYIWGAHLYRSDLGGMVDNPDRGDSYVPTTTSAVYLPRRGHHVWNGSAWVNEGVLHESDARTNLLAQSNDFSTWISVNTTVTDNAATGLDGLTSASTVVQPITTATSHYIFTTAAVTSGTTYTFSAFVKYVDWRYVNLDVSDGSFGNLARATFDLVNGVVTDGSNGTDTIENWGNGWWRIAMSVPATATNTSSFFVSFNNGSTFNNTFNGNGTSSFVIFGAQLEAAPTPSSYIPTAGSTVTRAADVMTIPAANLPWPAPEYIGPELVTNGTFDTDLTGWTALFGSISWSGGKLLLTEDGADGSSARAYQIITTEVGKVYRITADVGAVSLGGVVIAASNSTAIGGKPQVVASQNTSAELVFVAETTATYIVLSVQGTTARTAELDNISVREINPLAVSIQMDGRVTYADEDAIFTVRPFNWAFDGSNLIRSRFDTNGANTGILLTEQISAGVSDTNNVDLPQISSGILSPFNFASRHGSTFINAALGGTSATVNTTPVSLPDLSASNFTLGQKYNGTIRTFRIWADDIGNAGLVEATEPSLVPSLSLTFDGTENSFVVLDWSE